MVLPDADVIGYQYLYIPYGHVLGHRGFFHSPCFAAMFSLVAVSLFFRQERILSRRWWAYLLFFFVVGASHGLLDAMTNGYLNKKLRQSRRRMARKGRGRTRRRVARKPRQDPSPPTVSIRRAYFLKAFTPVVHLRRPNPPSTSHRRGTAPAASRSNTLSIR